MLTATLLNGPKPREVYRITLPRFASLIPSGKEARWNEEGWHVIYTAGTRELACLENVVHRTVRSLNQEFSCMVISFPEDLEIETVELSELPAEWYLTEGKASCMKRGKLWLEHAKAPILSVPSAIIHQSRNFLFNCNHPDFKHVKLESVEPFIFDNRLKTSPMETQKGDKK